MLQGKGAKEEITTGIQKRERTKARQRENRDKSKAKQSKERKEKNRKAGNAVRHHSRSC